MKKLRSAPRLSRHKKLACTVSAAALMLGVSSAATIGLHFQENYCGSAAYSGYPVTLTAFGIAPSGWENLIPMNTGYDGCSGPLGYTLNEVISTTTTTNGLNPLPNGSLNVTWFGPTANFSGFAGYAGHPPSYAYDGHPPGPNIQWTGEQEIYSTFLRDGYNFGPGSSSSGINTQPGYLVDVTGLKSLFTNSQFVVELVAAADSMQMLTNAFVVDVTNSITNSVTYPNTPPVTEDEGGEPWVRGHGGGLSTASGALNTDHIQIMSNHPLGGGNKSAGFDNAGTISGFIITDKPLFTMSPRSVLAGPGDTVLLNPYAIGVPPLSYQWRLGGKAIAGATNTSYTIAAVNLTNAGNYDLVVTNLYGATTSLVATVTADVIAHAIAAQTVLDSNPANPQRDGADLGATWVASNSDGTITRKGVMQFVAANTNGIVISASTNFDSTTGTITFWMRSAGTDTTTPGGEGASLVCVPSGTANNDFILLQLDGSFGNLQFQAPNSSGGAANLYDTGDKVSDNKWHFVALTFDQSATGGAAVFVDGAFDRSNPNSAAWSWPAGQPIEIGYSTDPTFRAYNGALADVRFYNTQLTTNQIVSIYQSGALAATNALQMQLSFSAPPGPGITLSWQESSAVLQSSSTVNGTYTDVPGVSSPYTIVPGAAQMFFRYRYVPQSQVSNPYLM